MITKFNKYEKIYEWAFHDEFHKEKIRNVDYYIDRIHKEKLSEKDIEYLFHWSCVYEFPELAVALSDIFSEYTLTKQNRSIAQIKDYKSFKKIIKKCNLVSLKNDRDFLEHLIHSNDDEGKIKLVKELGLNVNQKTLETACFSGKVNIVKYLVSIGLDPTKRREASFSHQPENCLDIATDYNKTPELIKYLVEKLNIPVTYRHMANVIYKENLDALPFLINSNNLIDDYSYSGWATHEENKHQYSLGNLLSLMISKKIKNKLIKKVLSKTKDFGYNNLQSLPRNFNLIYWIISNYTGSENSYTTKQITQGNKKFWLKKMKENPSIISKLRHVNKGLLTSYEYQKLILDIDPKNVKYIINDLHPEIEKEFSDIPEIFNKTVSRYNL